MLNFGLVDIVEASELADSLGAGYDLFMDVAKFVVQLRSKLVNIGFDLQEHEEGILEGLDGQCISGAQLLKHGLKHFEEESAVEIGRDQLVDGHITRRCGLDGL